MRRLPRTLFGRNVLLMVALIALGQLASGFAFWQYVQRPRIAQLAAATAQYVATLHAVAAVSTPDQLAVLRERINTTTRLRLLPAETALPSFDAPRNLAVRDFARALEVAMAADPLTREDTLRWQAGPAQAIWIGLRGLGAANIANTSNTAYPTAWAVLAVDRFEIEPTWYWLWFPWLVVAPALAGAYLIQRRINRPLTELARGAEALGRGVRPTPMSDEGPDEIAAVAKSFNRMTANLERAERERAIMLAGVSHDLRTPLTKLRLAAAMLEGRAEADLLRSMERAMEEIDATVGQFLDFARAGEGETAVTGDIDALLRELATTFAAEGAVFDLDLGPLPAVKFRPIATRRLVSNLMRNAVGHGARASAAQDEHSDSGWLLRSRSSAGRIEICVLDRGPGIAADDVERMKRPFVRNDGNPSQPGTGLGLAIVERIAALHGGELALRPREGGGLEACVRWPAAGAP
jgi:two-component system osmolarity sensor histidine kinase EnvZ